MHLALELDQSKQVSADPKRDLDLALTVLRKRIDEFGVEEPLVQKVGDNRIVVELAGITEPARAKAIVQRSAFLEFRITDKTNALEKALPAMDRTLREPGHQGRHRAPASRRRWSSSWAATRPRRPPPTAPSGRRAGKPPTRRPPRQAKAADGGQADSTAADTAPVVGGVLAGLIQPARWPAATPGRVRRARDRLPAGGQPDQPPGGGPAASARRGAPLGVGAHQRRGAVRTASSMRWTTGRIVTGSNLEDAAGPARPAHQRRRSSPSSSTAPAAASSARRPASTSATTWRSCSTAGCRAARR